ncbi:MAG: hypothetical protein NT165_01280 [Candidatus Falkowbacteria bacterium]|nr:hypothetical protein [Candidatus Falkowbacteria bacterium]
MFYFRLSVLLLPVLIFFSSEVITVFPKTFFIVLAASSLLIIYWSFWLFRKREKSKLGHWWEYAILPVIFNISSIFYFAMEPTVIIGQLVLLVNAYFLFNYLKNIYYLAANEKREEQLKNISFFGGVLTVFFASSVVYGAKVFLGLPMLPMFACLSLTLLAVWYQIFVFVPFSIKKNSIFFLIALLVLCQLGAVLFFLPFSYQLLGIILTIIFYFIAGIGRLHLNGEIPIRRLRYYLIFSILAVVFLILTARWL